MKLLLRIFRAPETITALLLLIALGIGAFSSDRFLHADFLLAKTSVYAPIGFMALAMTFLIIGGQIDLSVASGALLTSVAAGIAYRAGWPMGLIVPLALVFGMLLGLLNGLLITLLNLPALVVTLGTLALYRGVAQGWIGDGNVGSFPDWFAGMDNRVIGVVPLPVVFFFVAAIGLSFILTRTTFGRRVFALGTNESATRYSGISTRNVKLLLFSLSGLSMGAAALIQMSQIRVVDQKQFQADELLAITAVVLGGTSIFGGKGSITGSVLAILLLVAVRTAMGMNYIQPEYQLAIIGTLLVASVLLSDLSTRLFAQKRQRSSK